MSEVLKVAYYRCPDSLRIARNILSIPSVYIKISHLNGCGLKRGLLNSAQQKIRAHRYVDWTHKIALEAAFAYRHDEKIIPAGCKECPIHRTADSDKALRVCGGLNDCDVSVNRAQYSSTTAEGVVMSNTVFICKGYRTLGLDERQRGYLDKATQNSLDNQLPLLSKASCVLLPELT